MKLQTAEWTTAAAIGSFLSISRFLSLVSLFGGAFSLSSGLRVVGRCSHWTRTRIACWCYHAAWFFCRSQSWSPSDPSSMTTAEELDFDTYTTRLPLSSSPSKEVFSEEQPSDSSSLCWLGESFRSHIFCFGLWKTCLLGARWTFSVLLWYKFWSLVIL